MSFSSLLPAPEHTKQGSTGTVLPGREAEEAKSRALAKATANSTRGDSPSEDVSSAIHEQIAANVHFEDFIPLRQRNFNIEIPQPTAEDIQASYNKTLDFLKSLDAKHVENSTSAKKASVKTTTIGNCSVKVTTAVQDPLQPARFKKSGKVYTPNLEDDATPTTILHENAAPQLTAEERAKWQIPALVSQWKNPKGYTVERTVGSGEGTGVSDVNEGFSELSSALEQADKEAKDRLRQKSEAKQLAYEKEVQAKEEKLQLLAARRHRGQLPTISGRGPLRIEKPRSAPSIQSKPQPAKAQGVLIERLRELAHQEGRDVSDKVLLGTAKATAAPEVGYDSRLFLKGARSGARQQAEQVYTDPLFAQQGIDSIYRTDYSKLDSRVAAESGEQGDDGSVMAAVGKASGTNRGPIEFSRASDVKKSSDSKQHGLQSQK